jgi:hypothetical protein
VKVRDSWDPIRPTGAAALFVVQDEPALVRRTMLDGIDVEALPFPVLVDRERAAYDAWGLARIPWWRLWLDPGVWKGYLDQFRAGERLKASGEDPYQLGGDFVVAPDGTIAYSRPQVRDDRPPVGELRTTLRRLAD